MKKKAPRKSPRKRSAGSSLKPRQESRMDPALLDAMSLQASKRDGESLQLTSKQIERALVSGEFAGTLETYFGEHEYAELTSLAARAATRSRRGGPRVLMLPGILGSMLARTSGNKSDTIWIDFWDIMRGR